jgi:hypothetical protein
MAIGSSNEARIRAKIADYLRKSAALEAYWRRAITPDELQAELERMARDTRQPDALTELWAALAHDPLMIAECLARPALVERLLRDGYANDERFHGDLRRRAEAELRHHAEADAPARMRTMSGEYREVECRAFAKSVEVLADDLKPKTQDLKPINQSFVSSLKQWSKEFFNRF